MNTRFVPLHIVCLASLCLGIARPALADGKAAACPYLGQPAAPTKDKIGVFSATGKFLRDAERKDVAADARVLACNEELGLVKIVIAGEESWIDRLAVSIRPANAVPCATKSASRAPDRTEPVSSGIGEHCVQEKPKP